MHDSADLADLCGNKARPMKPKAPPRRTRQERSPRKATRHRKKAKEKSRSRHDDPDCEDNLRRKRRALLRPRHHRDKTEGREQKRRFERIGGDSDIGRVEECGREPGAIHPCHKQPEAEMAHAHSLEERIQSLNRPRHPHPFDNARRRPILKPGRHDAKSRERGDAFHQEKRPNPP